MEIRPIRGVRAVSLLNPSRSESTVPSAFAIDSSARTGDDAYSGSRNSPDRGLEEKESVSEIDGQLGQEMAEDAASGPDPSIGVAPPTISYFA
jgi:hypothetical protein